VTPLLSLALAAALLVGAAGAGRAQTADLARATCAGLNALSRPERAEMLVWLHGYYAGAAQRSVIDRERTAAAIAAMEAACERAPAMALIGVEARALFLGEPAAPSAPGAAPTPR